MTEEPDEASAKKRRAQEGSSPPETARSHRKALTRAQRKFLDRRDPPMTPPPIEQEIWPASTLRAERPNVIPAAATSAESKEEVPPADHPRPRGHGVALSPQGAAVRTAQTQHAIFTIGALLLLACTFWAGHRFDSLRYRLMSLAEKPKVEKIPEKFPGLSSPELIETGLRAEQEKRWDDAAERYYEAKQKNLRQTGILYRIGKMQYDRGAFDAADKAFAEALGFGESIGAANYFRGRIALDRGQLPTAQRFFENAANTDSFVSDFRYYIAETLRRDHHAAEAILRYEQAALRAATEQDATVCRFKIRLAMLEAGDAVKVEAELEDARAAGPLPVEWLMVGAALQMQKGDTEAAVALLRQARNSGVVGLFNSCAADMAFARAGESHPEIARLCAPLPARE